MKVNVKRVGRGGVAGVGMKREKSGSKNLRPSHCSYLLILYSVIESQEISRLLSVCEV